MSAQIQSKILNQSITGYFDITNPNSYAYSGAREWRDLSGNGLTFTLTGVTALPVYDATTGGLLFGSTNQQYAATPPSTIGPANGEYTWGVWAKFTNPTEISSGVQILTRGRDTTGAPTPDGWSLTVGCVGGYYVSACTQDDISSTSYTTSATSATGVSLNSWVNIIGTFKPNNYVKLYINGQFDAQTAVNGDNLRNSIGAGWVVASIQDTQYASCVVASALIYNRVLTDLEILQNYNATKARYGL
jgi:hypothetical protein